MMISPVSWHHSAEVALNAAPLLHTRMRLEDRCENALAGFVALDIFCLLSQSHCQSLGMPKGSFSMAGQTCLNLQSCALSSAIICLTKPTDFEPWAHGFGRLSELPVEQFFSFCRRQSENSQLSARAYWQASARQCLKMEKLIAKQPPAKTGSPALSQDQQLGMEWHGVFPVIHSNFIDSSLAQVILLRYVLWFVPSSMAVPF